MIDSTDTADARLIRTMTHTAERVLARERAYDVAIDAMGALLHDAQHAGHFGRAYLLWAGISDLFDDPQGPDSERLCTVYAEAAATDWLSIDSDSREAAASYFDRWEPGRGSAWRALKAKSN